MRDENVAAAHSGIGRLLITAAAAERSEPSFEAVILKKGACPLFAG